MISRASLTAALSVLLLLLSALVAAVPAAGGVAPPRASAASLPAAAAGTPVVGHRRYAAPYGAGWGRARPRRLDNGGVPSGIVFRIRWRSWGGQRAVGRGLTYLYKPDGGYYRRPGRIQLRAVRLGSCGNGPAYTRLRVRTVRRPGGRMQQRWHSWSGSRSLCRPQ